MMVVLLVEGMMISFGERVSNKREETQREVARRRESGQRIATLSRDLPRWEATRALSPRCPNHDTLPSASDTLPHTTPHTAATSLFHPMPPRGSPAAALRRLEVQYASPDGARSRGLRPTAKLAL